MSTPSPGNGVSASVSLTQIGTTGGDPFPMIDRLWEIYARKGIRTMFVSIGNSLSASADLDLAESLGCPIHCVPLNSKEQDAWTEITQILKDRKRDPETAKHSFSEGAEAKWILPKNIRSQPSLPWWGPGSIVTKDGASIATASIEEWLTPLCGAMKMKELEVRLDILKIDTTHSAPGLEKAILGAMLSGGIRPGIILVNWSCPPDSDVSATLAAGHLQNCGYHLINKLGNKFLYYFTDNDLYQICSWEETRTQNPMMQALINEAARTVKAEYTAAANLSTTISAPSQNSAPETEKGSAP